MWTSYYNIFVWLRIKSAWLGTWELGKRIKEIFMWLCICCESDTLCAYFDYIYTYMLQRITVPKILKNTWFRKGYKAPNFEKEANVMNLDDVDAVFDSTEVMLMFCFLLLTIYENWFYENLKSFFHLSCWLQENLVTEKKEKPESLNAFELISKTQNLENLFEKQKVIFLMRVSNSPDFFSSYIVCRLPSYWPVRLRISRNGI